MINQQEWDELCKTSHHELTKTRSRLMRKNLGVATMSLHLKFVAVTPDICETMATDGQRIIFNPFFIMTLPRKKLEGVFYHEVMHCIWEHCFRRQKRHFRVWNIACDYSINGHLVYDHKIELPDGGLLDRQYYGKSPEKIYSHLLKNEDDLKGAINDINNDLFESSENFKPDNDQKSSALSSGKNEKTGKKVGEIDLDTIPLPHGEVWDCQNDDGKKLSANEIDKLRKELKVQVTLSHRLEKSMSGDGTSGMSRRMDAIKNAQVNWNDQLLNLMQLRKSNDYNFSKPNRRYAWNDTFLPSRSNKPSGGEAIIFMDTSYSIQDYELTHFGGEVERMSIECGFNRIRVAYCDTMVRRNSTGSYYDSYDLDCGEKLKLYPRGGGGTLFDPCFHLFNKYTEDIEEVRVIIYFTDGYGEINDLSVEPDVPVIWCILGEESKYSKKLPFGDVIYIDCLDA
tara:strand:+ start:962 stop:2323 length:1362 start_codon:yes stop_codon:yes gene_type:complete